MAFFRKPIKEIYASYPAAEDKLEEIRTFIQSVCSQTDLTPKDLAGIQLAIEEACTNVIRHAYLYGPGTIRFKIVLEHQRVVFSIFDTGRSFDFGKASVATPDLPRYVKTGRKGGLGIYLIQKIMDDVSYFTSNGTNELRLIKILPRVARRVPLAPAGISIRVKFSLWAALLVLTIVTGVYLFFNYRLTASIQRNSINDALQLARTLAATAEEPLLAGSDLELITAATTTRKQHPELAYLVIVDDSSRVLANPDAVQQVLAPYALPSTAINPQSFGMAQRIKLNQQTIFHIITPVVVNSTFRGTVHIGLSEKPMQASIHQARRALLLICVISLGMGFLAVWLLALWFVKPIQKLTEGVLKIGRGDLDATLPIEGKDEFGEIAKAFNEITLKFKQSQESLLEQERLQKEMQVAQEIQQALLPARFPDIEGYDISTIYRAAKDVGGDYFDFFWIDEQTLGVVVADVSGKGVPGSLVMTMIRTAIRMEARGNRSPVDILTRVNDFVAEDVKKGMFITIFLVILDSKNRKISYASAGHNPMILYRKDEDRSFFLNPRGIPLGLTLPDEISFGASIQAEMVKLKKDDILIIYTDGITEAMNSRREQFGTQRLLDFIRSHSRLSAEEFTDKLNDELLKFTGNIPQYDDITLVAIKERLVADEVVFLARRRLLDLVEKEGKSIREACEAMGVSTTTYYKYKRRYDEFGDEGLKVKQPRSFEAIKQISYEDRQKLLAIIREHPEFGAARIRAELATERFAGLDFDERAIYDELVRLRLNTKLQRLEYLQRTRGELSDTQQTWLLEERQRQQLVQEEKEAAEQKPQVEQPEIRAGEHPARREALLVRLQEQGLTGDDLAVLALVAEELKQVTDDRKVEELFRLVADKVLALRQKQLSQPRAKVLDWSHLVDSSFGSYRSEPAESTTLDLKREKGNLSVEKQAPVVIPDEQDLTLDWENYASQIESHLKKRDES